MGSPPLHNKTSAEFSADVLFSVSLLKEVLLLALNGHKTIARVDVNFHASWQGVNSGVWAKVLAKVVNGLFLATAEYNLLGV